MKKSYLQTIFFTPLTGQKMLRLIFAVFFLLFLTALAELGTPVWAQEVISVEEPTPSSVDEVTTPMERSFKEKPPEPVLFPGLKEKLKDTPAFFRDTKLNLNIRTYYFYRDKYDDSQSEAWTLGGAVSYQSGWFLDRFSLGSVLYTSQRLYGPEDRDGTLLLKPGQGDYTVVGQLYGRVKLFEENFLNIYRYEYNTPFINKNDNRMTPSTFEGYTFNGAYGGKEGAPGFKYGGGYILKIKERNSDRFVWMSQDAGADVKRGVFLGGGSFSSGGFRIGVIDYYSDDIINIGYAEASYTLPVTKDLGLLFTAQFTDQRSVGEDLLKGYSFSTNQFGMKAAMGGASSALAIRETLVEPTYRAPGAAIPAIPACRCRISTEQARMPLL
jgi:hypothetical protein